MIQPAAAAHSSQTQVPFVDLKAQYASIREEMDEAMSLFNLGHLTIEHRASAKPFHVDDYAIRRVLESAHFVGGESVERFEQEFARAVGAKYCLGMSSGTSALELALKAAGIGAGDEVIVPANSFFATAEAVSNVGGRPVFADVCAETFHLDIASAERVVTPKTRAIIPVHLYGRAMDMAPVEAFASKHNMTIIEDAAQAQDVGRGGVKVGGAGRLTCFSFYPGKNLGAYGDAGAVTCNDPKLAEMLRLLRDHGSPTKYQHTVIGTNARLDSIQAAVLSVKLGHLANWNARRVQHAKAYAKMLAGVPVGLPQIPPDGEHNFHLFVVRTPKRDRLKTFLEDRGVGVGIHYPVPLHLTPAYQALGYPGKGSLPVTESLAPEILSLPMFPELAGEQIEHVVHSIRDFFGNPDRS